MTSETPQNQRRSPRQARSRATWEAIVEAAAQILERDGAAGFNTNSVAERAGVSIGTLYQYFPDKQAILAAAAKRELADGSSAAPARRRALIDALIAMVEGLGRIGGVAASASHPIAPMARRATRRGVGWERRCAAVLDVIGAVLVGPQVTLRPIPIRTSPSNPGHRRA
jgi:AcrR family transcriptional regulator